MTVTAAVTTRTITLVAAKAAVKAETAVLAAAAAAVPTTGPEAAAVHIQTTTLSLLGSIIVKVSYCRTACQKIVTLNLRPHNVNVNINVEDPLFVIISNPQNPL
jgi:hypothetical protein